MCAFVFVCWHCGEAMQTGHQHQKSYSGELLTARTAVKNWFRFELCLHSHSSHQANAHYFLSELCRKVQKVQIAQLTIVCLREKLLLKVMVISISELELSIKLRVSLGSGSDPRDCSVLFWKRMPEKNASDSPMNLSFFPSSQNI